jgi:hypothetical protein
VMAGGKGSLLSSCQCSASLLFKWKLISYNPFESWLGNLYIYFPSIWKLTC